MQPAEEQNHFWRDALALHGSVTNQVAPHVIAFGAISGAIRLAVYFLEQQFGLHIRLQVPPYEIAGAILGLLLVFRTNAGYDRWWEARRLWGGIVNQSRNFAITSLAYGPSDAQWAARVVSWAAVFPHVARCSLRGESLPPRVAELVGKEAANSIARAIHMPSYVALQMAHLLREATEQNEMDRFAFLQADKERALLIDHIGACERILKTPLPRVYAIKVRRFIFVFLLSLPLALVDRLENAFLVPVVTMLVAYPVISLDQIGVELQNPFSRDNLSHLPLDEIAANIERNVLGLSKPQ